MKSVRWIMALGGIGLMAAGGFAVPRRIESPKSHQAEYAEVQGILDEIDATPLLLVGGKGGAKPLKAAALPQFPADVMARYRVTTSLNALKTALASSSERFVLIRAVLQAKAVLEKRCHVLADTLSAKGRITDQLKAKLFKDQRMLASSMHALREALEVLDAAGEQQKEAPSLRWRANYDYVRARLMMRIVHLHEYNLMLGMVRRGALPPLGNGQSGWRIIPVSGLQTTERDIKLLDMKSKAVLKKLTEDHPNTPWAYLAKRDLDALIGLDWIAVQ